MLGPPTRGAEGRPRRTVPADVGHLSQTQGAQMDDTNKGERAGGCVEPSGNGRSPKTWLWPWHESLGLSER